jgi:hypothetical protein
MNFTYTKVLARKILLVFLLFTVIFSIVALIVRNTITKKLDNVSKLSNKFERGQSKPGQVLLLLHQAEDDFQEWLLDANSKKSAEYKVKLLKAFDEIDTLLKETTDTTHLSPAQRNKVIFWYHRKLVLSDKLYGLRHNFDSLLTVYSNFDAQIATNTPDRGLHSKQTKKRYTTDTTRKIATPEKKGLLRRLKDAISNKSGNLTTEINHNKNTQVTNLNSQKILAENKVLYNQQLRQLQQRNVNLLNTQKELIVLNTRITNELERIINDVKDINFSIANSFKEIALKNYQETTQLLNKFYLTDLFLVMGFAISLIIFIIKLNRAEIVLRKENEQSIIIAQQKIDELIKKIIPEDSIRSPSKIDELEEIVHLAMSNNPTFLMKFNEFDPEFIKKLLCISPSLMATEIEFCVLLRLNFETKEIARYTKTSVRSVEGKKYRIRKKLTVPGDQDINIWMTNI